MAGKGLAQRLLQPLVGTSRGAGLRQSALVSVQGSEGYWQRHGQWRSRCTSLNSSSAWPAMGKGVVYMARTLQPFDAAAVSGP